MIALCASLAVAGGGGLYVEVAGGGGWADATGPLIRGVSGYAEVGGFAGSYRGSMRYGQYTRIGLRGQWHDTELPSGGHHTVLLGALSVGRGADLMNIGGFWTVAAGPILVDSDDLERAQFGGGFRGSVGVRYNITRWFGVGVRIDGGVDLRYRHTISVFDASISGGFGLNLLFRAPLWTPRDAPTAHPDEVIEEQ